MSYIDFAEGGDKGREATEEAAAEVEEEATVVREAIAELHELQPAQPQQQQQHQGYMQESQAYMQVGVFEYLIRSAIFCKTFVPDETNAGWQQLQRNVRLCNGRAAAAAAARAFHASEADASHAGHFTPACLWYENKF